MRSDRGPRVRRWILVAAMASACGLAPRAESAPAQLSKLGAGSKGTYRVFRDASGRFEIEYPTKDWRLPPSAGTSVAAFARNDGRATLAIDYSKLAGALARSDIAYQTMKEVQLEELKERRPQATEITSELVETKAGRGALIRYATVGATGPERAIQFSVPVGLFLYHIIAIASESVLSKNEEVLLHMIESFQAPASPPNPKN
jgi:hypothetical protein